MKYRIHALFLCLILLATSSVANAGWSISLIDIVTRAPGAPDHGFKTPKLNFSQFVSELPHPVVIPVNAAAFAQLKADGLKSSAWNLSALPIADSSQRQIWFVQRANGQSYLSAQTTITNGVYDPAGGTNYPEIDAWNAALQSNTVLPVGPDDPTISFLHAIRDISQSASASEFQTDSLAMQLDALLSRLRRQGADISKIHLVQHFATLVRMSGDIKLGKATAFTLAYSRMSRLQTSDPWIRADRGRLALYMCDTNAAYTDLQAAIRSDSDAYNLIDFSRAAIALGRFDEATEALDFARTLIPTMRITTKEMRELLGRIRMLRSRLRKQ